MIPGVGMNAPRRYTPSKRQRKQHTVAQVRRAEDVPKCFDQLLHCRTSTFPPALRDFFLRRFAEGVRAHGERNFQFAVTEDFDAVALRANDPAPGKRLRRDRFARGERR